MDLLITGGQVIDGTGAPLHWADVGIAGGRVVAVGELGQVQAVFEIDAQGCIVCPGFIDMHSHADLALLTGRDMDGRLRQGITTEVLGQDGLSYAPACEENLDAWRRYLIGLNGDAPDLTWKWRTVAEYLGELEGRASNAVYLIAHGAVRVEAMGWDARPATESELRAMRSLVRQGLAEGAAGLATGLSYVPCAHATTDEVVALCQEVGEAGGLYVTHLRSYGKHLLAAIDEAIEIGQRSGAGVHISHLRMTSPANWGLSSTVLAKIDRAREEGVEVSFDLYPYTAGCAPLFALLPLWAQSGGADGIMARLRDPADVQRMTAEMVSWGADWTAYTLSNARSVPCGEWDGATLCDAAAELGMPVEAFIPQLLLESELDATIISAGGSEADNERLFAHPACVVGSDGVLLGKHPHPRGFGCYPRVLARYVRQTGLLSWEEAIHKMTGLPAARLNLPDRGHLREGAWADVVVLDPERVADAATFCEGRLPPAGIEWVLVNGQVVVERGQFLGSEAGQALRPQRRGQRPGKLMKGYKVTDFGRYKLGTPVDELDTPALLLDLAAFERNVARMAAFFADKPATIRPHSKSHKCPQIALRQLEAGAIGITCAKVSEAEVMAGAGIKDILVANQVSGRIKIDRATDLAGRCNLMVAVDDAENVRRLSEASAAKGVVLRVLVEVDIGMGRCGVQPGQPALDLARQVAGSPGLQLEGLMAYEGHLVMVEDPDERAQRVRAAFNPLADTVELFEHNGLPVQIVSSGGTGTYDVTGTLPFVTELQCGSYVLMDNKYRTIQPGFEPSLTVLSTVVSRPVPGRIVVDAGLKSMTTEFGWPLPLDGEGLSVRHLSEEHGNLDLAESGRFDGKPGDRIRFMPSHCCTTVNLHDAFYVIEDGKLVDIWPIAARGCSQ